mgnify:CR=1 FL=1
MEYSKLVYEGQYCSVKQFLEEGNCKDKYYIAENEGNGYYYIDCDGKRQRGAYWFTILGDAIESAKLYDASAASWSISLGPGIKAEHLQRIAAQVALGATKGVIE